MTSTRVSTAARPQRILGTDAARAVGRFRPGSPTGYQSKIGGPIRATREEAEKDYDNHLDCSLPQGETSDRQLSLPVSAPAVRDRQDEPEQPFPAVAMESLAREKAWHKFLVEIRYSLEIWSLDTDVRDGCENVVSWISRCAAELKEIA